MGDQFVLWVSMFTVLQSPHFRSAQPEGLNGNTTYKFTAPSLAGPYRAQGTGRILDRDYPGGPYACEAVLFKGQWYLLGTCWSDRLGDSICDPIPIAMA
ncbi:MAG: hypothetical protein LR015_05115 [Verrucomicrobia bacterium]|nr:hypothetical protein [Verrucomicrobiota bacterium]